MNVLADRPLEMTVEEYLARYSPTRRAPTHDSIFSLLARRLSPRPGGPAAFFEIISEDTRRVDEREKRVPYLQLPSLQAYVRIEQARPEVVVDRRTPEGWKSERVSGLDAVVRLPELGIELPLGELFERVTFHEPRR